MFLILRYFDVYSNIKPMLKFNWSEPEWAENSEGYKCYLNSWKGLVLSVF